MHPYTLYSPYFYGRTVVSEPQTVWTELQMLQCVEGACVAVVNVIQELYPLHSIPSLPPLPPSTAVASGNGPGNYCTAQLCWSRTASIMLDPASRRHHRRGNENIQEGLHTSITVNYFLCY